MLLEEFLVELTAEADTDKVKGFGAAMAKVATIGAVVVSALKTASLAAWAFADSYVRRAADLYKSNSDLYQITKEQVEMSERYQEGMGRLGKMIEAVKIRIAFGFLPTMLEMVNTFNRFLDANKDLIVNGIGKLLNAISVMSQVISSTFQFITKGIEMTIGWEGALYLLAAAFLWVKRAMILAFVTNPIAWVIAAIVGLMLLIDDFMTYLDGGESQFGEFWGSMLGWIEDNKDAINTFIDNVKMLGEAFVYAVQYIGSALFDLVDLVANTWNFIASIFEGNTENIKKYWSGMVSALLSMFANFAMLFEPLARKISEISQKVWTAIVDYIKGRIDAMLGIIRGAISSLGSILSTVFDIVTSPFRKAFDWISDKFSGLGNMISGAISGMGRLAGVSATAAVNTSNQVNSMSINAPISVSTSNPNIVAPMIQKSLTATANSALGNMGSKVIV